MCSLDIDFGNDTLFVENKKNIDDEKNNVKNNKEVE